MAAWFAAINPARFARRRSNQLIERVYFCTGSGRFQEKTLANCVG